MGENSCYTSLGKLLLLRVAVSASLATCVWAHQDSDDHDHHHHHHNHGRDRGDERSALVITILKFYAIVTGVALLLLALGVIAFACCSVCCFRCGRGKGKGIIKGDSEVMINKNGNNDCKLGPQKVGGVIGATLCWPVVIAGLGCMVVLKLGDTLKRCKVVEGRTNSEVGGSSTKEAAVGDSPKIDRDISEKTPPISAVEEGSRNSIELDFL